MLEPLEPRQLLDGGQLDQTFGISGRAEIDFSPVLDAGFHAVITDHAEDRRGRIVALAEDANGTSTHSHLLIARVTGDGQLDVRFGVAGIVSLPRHFPQTPDLAVDAFDRIYIRDETRLYRLTTTGRFDRSFGNGGKLTIPRMETPFDMQTDDEGRVLLFGTDATAVRLTERGKLDKSWGSNGVFHAPITAPAGFQIESNNIKGARVLPDGRVVMAIEEQSEGAFDPDTDQLRGEISLIGIRVSERGVIDTTYGTGGAARRSEPSDTLLFNSIFPDGSIVGNVGVPIDPDDLQGDRTWSTFQIAADGESIDTPNYIPTGIVFADVGLPRPYVKQRDGKILSRVTGKLLRLNSDGAFDADFGSAGMVDSLGAWLPTIARDQTILADTNISGTAGIARFWSGDAPVVSADAVDVDAELHQSIQFSVTWRDDDGIDASTVDARDVFIQRPDGTRTSARLAGVNEVKPGVFRATYKLSAADGKWDANDNGVYAIFARTNAVRDVHGVGNAGASIGDFRVRIGQN